jgi:Fur family ferric uptake transcriptional regulator
VQCGKVVEFLDQTIERCQEEVAKKEGFKIRDHSLIIYGDCTRKNCPNLKS